METTEGVVNGLNKPWVNSWREKLESSSSQLGPDTGTIFKVPEFIRATDPGAYDPKFISIGPYHHHSPQLKSSNYLKLLYVKRILARNPRLCLEDYLKLMDGLATQARNHYHGELNMSKMEFVDMLMMDGCFIVELLLFAKEKINGETGDPITAGHMPTQTLVKYDMLLIENQLPFFVLERLFDLLGVSYEDNSTSIINLAINFFGTKSSVDIASTGTFHLLHLFHSCITNETVARRGSFESHVIDITVLQEHSKVIMIPPARDLRRTIMILKREEGTLWNMSLKRNTLEISPVQLHSNSSSLFRNMIAFEQHFSSEVNAKITAYTMFMARLIESGDDLDFLRRQGIVSDVNLESREAAVHFFKKLCKDTVVNYNEVHLRDLYDISAKIRKVTRTIWRRWIGETKTFYSTLFSKPETRISLVYGVLFVSYLTAIQTFVSVLSYAQQYHKKG